MKQERRRPLWARSRLLFASGMVLLLATANARAQSNVQLYGVMDLWMGGSKISSENSSTGVVNSGGMTTSYWGMGGSEDLGGGTRVSFAAESYLQADTGGAGRTALDAFYSRSAFVGLSGSFGEVKMGRLINPLFFSTAGSNPFGGSTRFGPLLAQTWTAPFGRAVFGDTSWDNAIAYSLPAMGSIKVTAQYGFGEVVGKSGANNFLLNFTYKKGDLYGTIHVQKVKTGPGIASLGISEQNTYFAGGSYDLKAAKLFASYSSAEASTPDLRSRTGQLGISMPLSGGEIQVSWARTRRDQTAVPSIRETVSLGYDYFLSKRTDVYAIGMHDKSNLVSAGNSFGVGIRYRF